MKLSSSLVAVALAISPVLAVIPVYGQCGGIGWTGETG